MSDKDGGRLPDRGPASRLRFEKDAPQDTPATSGRNVQKSRQGQRPAESVEPEQIRDTPAGPLRFEHEDAAPAADTPPTSGRNVQKPRQGKRPAGDTGPEPFRDAPASSLRFEHEDAAPATDTPASRLRFEDSAQPHADGGKFRQDKEQARPSDRLRLDDP
ncbi:MAG: hypothetical protein LIO46_02125, partial [Clostridiales bacterium]|nr:hypothetical protein [Clostridiales bacterium]